MTSAREAVAVAVNSLTDGLNDEDDTDLEDAASRARETLVLLLDRDDVIGGKSARARVKMSRGTGTRDSDEWVIEGSGSSAGEAREEFEELLDDFEKRWAGRVRGIDPYEE